jgi:hypothetical protein
MVKFTIAFEPHVQKVRLVEHIIVGGVLSISETVCEQVAVLPQSSVARKVRVAWNVRPQSALVTVLMTSIIRFVPEQASATAGGPKVHGVPHATTRLEGQAKAGGVVSTTVMVCAHVVALLHASVARHVRTARNVVPQAAFVTVLTTAIATLAPLRSSVAVGVPNVHDVGH